MVNFAMGPPPALNFKISGIHLLLEAVDFDPYVLVECLLILTQRGIVLEMALETSGTCSTTITSTIQPFPGSSLQKNNVLWGCEVYFYFERHNHLELASIYLASRHPTSRHFFDLNSWTSCGWHSWLSCALRTCSQLPSSSFVTLASTC